MTAKFFVVVALQVLLLTSMIGYKQYWISTGERVVLKTVPVDPRDIFRGDYVLLNYEISSIDLDVLSSSENFAPNETVYVTLGMGEDGAHKAVSVSKSEPSGGKFIQGKVRQETQTARWQIKMKDDSNNVRTLTPLSFSGFTNGDRVTFCLDKQDNVLSVHREDVNTKPQCPTGSALSGAVEDIIHVQFKQLNVEYGIEAYFVEEGKGKMLETARNARDLRVEVALQGDGKGIITGLMMEGKIVK